MDLTKIWKKRRQILEGWLYSTVPGLENKDARELRRKIADERLAICRSNKCGYYDEKGESENLVVPGQPGCRACGCPLARKTMALSDACGLHDIGQEPLWTAVLTGKQELEFEKKLVENED